MTLSLKQDFKTVIPIILTKQTSSLPHSHGADASNVRISCDMEIPGRTVQFIAGHLDNFCGDISMVPGSVVC